MAVVLSAILGSAVWAAAAPAPATEQLTEFGCRRPIVEVTVSPLIDDNSIRLLELSWTVESFVPGDWLGLYQEDPSDPDWSEDVSPLSVVNVTKLDGWHTTQVQELRQHSAPSFVPICLGFWVAYWRPSTDLNQDELVTSSCLQTNPDWLNSSRSSIQDLKLVDLFIPGTHDSASYKLAYEPFKESRIQKYIFTQDESVLNQLIHGARFIDLRVGYYGGQWWANHGIARVHPLQEVISDIKIFLANTNEIVILDIHNFPYGFGNDISVHHMLAYYLVKELSDYMVNQTLGWQSTLRQIWDSKRRLIISYNDVRLVSESHYMWPAVHHKWADVRSLDSLKAYLEEIIKWDLIKKPRHAWAAMAEFTATPWSFISNKYGGLRKMADRVNKNVTYWFRSYWGKTCNIVAVDFIRGTGIVRAAIDWNKRRAKKDPCDDVV